MRPHFFTEWTPDEPDLNSKGERVVKNAMPKAGGYEGFRGLSSQSDALDAYPRGAFAGADKDMNVEIYGADGTKLYKLASGAFSNVTAVSLPASFDTSFEGGYLDAEQDGDSDSSTTMMMVSTAATSGIGTTATLDGATTGGVSYSMQTGLSSGPHAISADGFLGTGDILGGGGF